MINLDKWTKDFVGKWVKYTGYGLDYLSHKVDRNKIGKIKFRSGSGIFVVYECEGNWNKYGDYEAVPTEAKDLEFCEAEPMTKGEILFKGREYEGGNKD